MNRLLLAALMSAALAQTAFAQAKMTSDQPAGATNSAQDAQNGATLPQQIKQKLESAGFSDVRLKPAAYFVQAKDKEGDPVDILITPQSMMEVTALNANEQDDVTSSGSSNSKGGNR
jgi:hypothetical protein